MTRCSMSHSEATPLLGTRFGCRIMRLQGMLPRGEGLRGRLLSASIFFLDPSLYILLTIGPTEIYNHPPLCSYLSVFCFSASN